MGFLFPGDGMGGGNLSHFPMGNCPMMFSSQGFLTIGFKDPVLLGKGSWALWVQGFNARGLG